MSESHTKFLPIVSFALGFPLWLFAQGVDMAGGQVFEEPKVLRTFGNRGPVQVAPPPPSASDQLTFSDPEGRMEVMIDRNHGYLKQLRFPRLFDKADARSIDRYIVLEGVSSSELDDEVIGFKDNTKADTPHIVVECLNRRSGIAVRKIYKLDPANLEVIKTVELESPRETILNIVSATVLSGETLKGGYYYQYISHTASHYSTFPTASVRGPYFVNGRNMQSGLCTVTRPDIDFTFGEVQLSINGVPEYLGINADGEPNIGRLESLVTPEGWQLPRGNWVLLGPGQDVQTKSWLYAATRGTHLKWHDNFQKRFFFAAFAPERRLDKALDLAFDTSFLWAHAATEYREGGRLELIEGNPELWKAGLNKRWENEPIYFKEPDGTLLWHQRLDTFDAAYAMFEALDLGPRAWATLGIAETLYTMGDLLADHMWYAPGVYARTEDMKKVPMEEYYRFVQAIQKRWPRFHLFNYERGTYYAHGDTIQANPEFAFAVMPGGGYSGEETYTPLWEHFFPQMTEKYLGQQKEGVSLYIDWATPGTTVVDLPDGKRIFRSYESAQIEIRKMSRKLRDAGSFYYVNQPSGPWADFGYIEGGSWDTDTRADWRFWGDRLQLYKVHEFRPNTVVALDMMCEEFIHQCLLYNFVPSTMNRVGVTTAQSWAPKELIRLRWYLREASMVPVPLRPVAWETPDSPLETAVMTLPGTIYLGAYNHATMDHATDLSVDLASAIDEKPYMVWRTDVTKGPWVGTNSEPGVEPHKYFRNLEPNLGQVGYKYERAEVSYAPARNAEWDGLRLKLRNVKIPKRSTAFFFLSRVPAVVRSVEGRDVMWPVSSQPHIRIEFSPDGTLLIRNDYTEVVLAVSPDWLTDNFEGTTKDEMTGWPSITVASGTWRLTNDGRLIYDSRTLPWPAHVKKSLVAAIQPIRTHKRILGTETLAAEHVLVLQNGVDGYQGQSNEQMTTGQWGGEVGADSHGPDDLFLYANPEQDRYAVDLIRFNLAGSIPEGAKVTRAVLTLHAPKEGGGNVASGYKVLKPWTDGKTWWSNWGHGGRDPGYIAQKPACTGRIGPSGSTPFVVDGALVQAWVNDPASNHGVLLKARDADANFHWWGEGAEDENPPKLLIEYNVE